MSFYEWVLYLHFGSILGFLTTHGIAIGTVLKLRRGTDAAEMRTLLSLSRTSIGGLHGSLFAVLLTGVALGFLGGWWSQLWIWAALVTLFIGWGIMGSLGTRYYDRARSSLGLQTFYKSKNEQPADRPDITSADVILRSSRSIILTILGSAGLLFMLWLMLFKPF